MRELGGPETHYAGQPSGRADSQSNRVGGGGLALRRLEIDESRDIAKYGKQMKMLGDQPSVAFCRK